MLDIHHIVNSAHDRRASDIHIVYGLPIRIRVDGQLEDLDDYVLTHDDCDAIGYALAGEDFEKMEGCGELDSARTLGDGYRCRINIFRQQKHTSAVVRILSDNIPLLEDLSLPAVMEDFTRWQRGIVLITGETGSGKSTTLAALLDKINHSRREHIITLEDPVEYVYKPDLCTINQREIGSDTASYEDGLKAILREDPDVILIGEMRSLDTIETALTAAETGHLVFATLHTNSAPDAVDRIVSVFPGEKQAQIRLQLSMVLKAVVSQQLVVRKGGKGRIAACEIMIANNAIRNLIREGNSPQLVNVMSTTAAEGNISMDNALIKMVKENVIDKNTAVDAAHDLEYVKKALGISSAAGLNKNNMGMSMNMNKNSGFDMNSNRMGR